MNKSSSTQDVQQFVDSSGDAAGNFDECELVIPATQVLEWVAERGIAANSLNLVGIITAFGLGMAVCMIIQGAAQ